MWIYKTLKRVQGDRLSREAGGRLVPQNMRHAELVSASKKYVTTIFLLR